MIEIQNMTFGYSKKVEPVFDDFSLSLPENRIYGLLGKNGMGKSTLLNLVCGLLRPQQGRVYIDCMDVNARRVEMLQDVYIVPETFEMPRMSMMKCIEMHRDFYPRFSDEVLIKCLSEFELPEVKRLNELSMGQKKKVYMCLALTSGTRLLVMDEPTNGLDIPSKSLFRKIIANNMTEERTMIISTHQVHDVESLLDHILLLDHSQLLLNASVGELTDRYTFGYRRQSEMDDTVIYAEPALQGNAVMCHRQTGDKDTLLNLELLFNAMVNQANFTNLENQEHN
ncbi:ATP-binding cassette domain-containing protein [Prevotella sp. S7 MS 2]|uniref:ATP-binding cassette domain-containing protein n=1 Tax=Prevotella sp. S7 MS 2 TaxID=1287488 RepID=UPI000512B58C|nr:ATP-binding cassette domain-containing protein [Prevotella sp. S7 MS 2]KGI59469.1 ABC transporter ATP-binding protein [Prevotella sp. S7 MS 2]